MRTVVSNTSPLSNLAYIGELDLLLPIYPQLLIPPAVYQELICFPPISATVTQLIQTGVITVRPPTDDERVQALNQPLDWGEAEAIALAIELQADRLLIDERWGRQIAVHHGLKIRGILGILVNARQQQLIPSVQPILHRLKTEAGFRMSAELYARILREVGEV